MEYRVNRQTGDRISVIGLGTSYIAASEEKTAIEALIYAYEHGINYADLATAGVKTFSYYGTAFRSVRDKMHYQIHFGANYETGEYGWTTDLETVKRQIDWQLRALKTDYINYGFIHCLDEESDWKDYQENGVLEYLLDMKKSGTVQHIGLSTHGTRILYMEDGTILDELKLEKYAGKDEKEASYRRAREKKITDWLSALHW